jgi:hypothetical protein
VVLVKVLEKSVVEERSEKAKRESEDVIFITKIF